MLFADKIENKLQTLHYINNKIRLTNSLNNLLQCHLLQDYVFNLLIHRRDYWGLISKQKFDNTLHWLLHRFVYRYFCILTAHSYIMALNGLCEGQLTCVLTNNITKCELEWQHQSNSLLSWRCLVPHELNTEIWSQKYNSIQTSKTITNVKIHTKTKSQWIRKVHGYHGMLNQKKEPTNRMLEAGIPTQRLLPGDQI